MKEKNPTYTKNNRRGNRVATQCRICGGKLYTPEEIKQEMHDKCNKQNKNIYMM